MLETSALKLFTVANLCYHDPVENTELLCGSKCTSWTNNSPHNQLFQSNISEIPYCTINPSSDADSLDDQNPNWDCHKQSVCEKNILKE